MRSSGNHPAPDARIRRGYFVRLAVLIFLLIAALQSISFYVESLWYGSLGFESVYWYRLRAQFMVFVAVAVVTGLVLWTIIRLVTPPPGHVRRSVLQFGNETIIVPTSDS